MKPFPELARVINAEIERLFPKDIQILAEPGRFLVATSATSVARVIGKAIRNGKRCYYIDDSVYHTFSGIIFDHCQYPFAVVQSRARRKSVRCLVRRATDWMSSRNPSCCPT